VQCEASGLFADVVGNGVTSRMPKPQNPQPHSSKSPEIKSIARNKRARFDYHILETWEAGLVLTGTEVKSLRDGRANISDAYGIIKDGEAFLLNLHISQYERGGYTKHEPTRTRKLLLHRKEIRRLIGAVERQGLTLVPLELYFKNGVAKVALALARGKKVHDKRDTERSRDAEREMARVARSR
jgi:SsrA-binding protein